MPRALSAFLLILLACAAGAQTEVVGSIADAKPFVPNNRWAMVIGVSKYSEDVGALRYTAKEAREFAASLKNDLQFDDSNLKLLADDGKPDEAPTSARVLASLDSLLKDRRLDKGNLFIFYFSGHGVATPHGDYLLPADAKKGHFEEMGVPVREVIGRIVGAGLKNVLFITDACRAGTQNDFGLELSMLCHKANIAVMLGCAPGKRSYEYSSLKQGAFTHFLMESLHQPELRDPSGALWASKVGEDVQKKVHEFTERDHGKYAQVPTLWGDASTLDVLVAAYPPATTSASGIQAFKKSAEKLSRSDYANALTNYAVALQDLEKYDEAVNLLKTSEQLGELGMSGRTVLAIDLGFLGRMAEAEKTYAAIVAEGNGYWKDFAITISTSRNVDPQVRLSSADRLLRTDPDWNIKKLAFNTISRWGTPGQKLLAAKALSALPGKTERQRLYEKAQVATLEGHWEEAISAYTAAAAKPGASPSDLTIFLDKLTPILANGDQETAKRYLNRIDPKGPQAAYAYLLKAIIAKQQGQTEQRVEFLRKALTAKLEPAYLMLAAKTAGPYMGQLESEFKVVADQNPYSWRARMVVGFIGYVRGDEKAATEMLAASERYVDDPVISLAEFFDFMEQFLAEGVELKTVPLETYRAKLDLFFLLMKDYAPLFGYDPDVWQEFIKFGLFGERNVQVQQVVSRYFPGTPDKAPENLRPMLMFLALNNGDRAAMSSLFKASFDVVERRDPTWFFACYLATLNQPRKALELVRKLGAPSKELAIRMEALRTYLLAATGEGKLARQRLAKPSEDIVVQAWHGLAWAALGDWKKAEPLLQVQVRDRLWAYLFVQEYAIRTLYNRLETTNRGEEARDVAFSAMISQPGNPLFNRYSFAPTPGVEQFAGTTAMNAVVIDDKDPNLQGSLSFTVTASGALSGEFAGEDGKKIPFTGSVDALGNVTGSCNWVARKCKLMGKIAPPALYRSNVKFRDPGQVLQLVDQDGFRIVLLGRMQNTG
jgi:uncharacterized caspase-like protein